MGTQDMTTWMVMVSPPNGAGGPPRATEQAAPANGTAVDPSAPPGGAGGAGGAGGGGADFIWILFILLGVMLLFTILGQRRERKKRETLMSSIKKHDRVQTIGGVIGSVVEIKDSTVTLKVDESSNTRITFARSAIQQVLSSGPETAVTDSSK